MTAQNKQAKAEQGDLIETKDREETLEAENAALREKIDALDERLAQVERSSHDQDLHANTGVHEESGEDYWDEPGILDHAALREPRPGMVQLWVRTHVRGEEDASNVFREFNRGWRPRQASTLPRELQGTLAVDFNDQQVIGVRGMILCERPTEDHERQMRMVRGAAKAQIRAVERRLGKVGSEGGLGAPRFVERHGEIERGRPDALPIDED